MAESNQSLNVSQPPPAPPLPPPSRPSVLQRLVAPLAFNRPQRPQGTPVVRSSSASPKDAVHHRPYRHLVTTRAAIHRTGISITAIDINDQGTHAILAGRDILKTVKVQDQSIFEELNIRSAVNNYISTQSLKPDEAHKRRQYLPAEAVRWSHKHYSHVIATAAQHGRIALYDVSRISSRVDLHHLYQHTGRVHKLDFDPHSGYMLLSASEDKYCKIWDIREPKKPKGYSQYHARAPVRDVRWSPTDAMEFALCTEDGTVQKWDVRNSQQPVLGIRAHEKRCYTLSWHPDGKHVATGSVDKSLKVWDLKSTNRKQKPVFHLRCPADIMKLSWRPSSWSADFAERGTWQTTEIAASYTDDDPRIHVWDLRRPMIPVRELNQHEIRPRDLLWASKDLLWVAGDTGSFTQNDVNRAPRPEDSLAPCSLEWATDGSFYAVTEDKTVANQTSVLDSAAMFLNIPHDKLSGADDSTTSRSLTDEEGLEVSLAEHTSQRQSKATSTRSVKSQANTPPTREELSKTLSLDKAVMAKKDMFVNGQVGAMTQIPGAHLPVAIVKQVSRFYARPMTKKERQERPNEILDRLQQAFQRNSAVCRLVGYEEQAKNWQILETTIMPELKIWADKNRRRRIAKDLEDQDKKEEANKTNTLIPLSPLPKATGSQKEGKSPAARSEKLLSNLFRGVVDSHKGNSDSGSYGGSNTTTPRQRPASNSPAPRKQAGSTWFTLDDAIEPIQPLPPSLANSHSTAAAASRALVDTVDNEVDSPMSSPEKAMSSSSSQKAKGHRRSATESSPAPKRASSFKDDSKETANDGARAPLNNRTQEDRRAALRDYKAPPKQPFSFDAPITSPRYGREDRHDSAESFQMFSASMGSSVPTRSLGRVDEVLDSVPESSVHARKDSDVWAQRDSYYDSVGRSGKEWSENRSSSDIVSQAADFAMDESPLLPFGSDVVPDPKTDNTVILMEDKGREVLSQSPEGRDIGPDRQNEIRDHIEAEVNVQQASASEHDDRHGPYFPYTNRTIHHFNPLLQDVDGKASLFSFVAEEDCSLESPYDTTDFRPIDITKYESCSPWAFSAYSIICTIIELDVTYGVASSQFAAHLLSHVYPFFFHHCFSTQPSNKDFASMPSTISAKLQHPAFRSRVIESIFASHIEYLTNLHLYLPAAEFRKLCVEEFGFFSLADVEAATKQQESAGEQLKTDPRMLRVTCVQCKQLIATDVTICRNCKQVRDKCPICELPLAGGCDPESNFLSSQMLTAFCHTCGHSAHLSCMSTWFNLPDTHGECPTPGCGCDCAPGSRRTERVARQVLEREERDTIRGSTSSAASNLRKDPRRASVSPAVEKARDSLRKGSAGKLAEREKPTHSGDEKTPSSGGTMGSAWSKKGTSASAGRGLASGVSLGRSNSTSAGSGLGTNSVGTSLGRRVRVVEPDET